ncbi:deoxynucleoside triphosphate triphosphohydrolase SAMHD1-like [Branchiostoma floridae x Branchiostoma belcheri]
MKRKESSVTSKIAPKIAKPAYVQEGNMAAAPGEEGRTPAEGAKIFNDPIHGHIKMHPLCVKIIDTPQFQRLRNIKQLGATDRVYPGAVHTRFEHSLGVCHLAECLVTKLQQDQPELDINERDVLCVMVAALCHDLGHGPFSHLLIIAKQHEKASIDMFEHLIKENKIDLKKYGLKYQKKDAEGDAEGDADEDDYVFIKELIKPIKPLESGEWQYEGRKKDKSFLYQIVSNDQNGMDVDKWDYFARDSQHLGLESKFDHMQLIHNARVIEVDGERQICYRDKDWDNVHYMFYIRARLHRKAYQHKVKDGVEMMILDALLEADKVPLVQSEPGKDLIKMSEAKDDMAAYTNLTDYIFEQILHTTGDELKPAREILNRIRTRELYRCVAETKPENWDMFNMFKDFESDDPSSLKSLIVAESTKKEFKGKKITSEDIGVKVVKVDFGKGNENPVTKVKFWKKDSPGEAESLNVQELSRMLPANFADQFVRVYCKNLTKLEESKEAAERCFDDLREKKKNETTPKKRPPTTSHGTPRKKKKKEMKKTEYCKRQHYHCCRME